MKARHLALCGLLSALAVTALLLGGILPLATFCAPVLAMAALLPIQEELGPRAAATAWAAVSLLALMLVSDRETALVFVFFDWYPVLRPRLAALPSRLLRILVRLGSYGLAVSLLYGLVLRLMGLTADSLRRLPARERRAAGPGRRHLPDLGPGAGAAEPAVAEQAPPPLLPLTPICKQGPCRWQGPCSFTLFHGNAARRPPPPDGAPPRPRPPHPPPGWP